VTEARGPNRSTDRRGEPPVGSESSASRSAARELTWSLGNT
jgi:hypothetical protein